MTREEISLINPEAIIGIASKEAGLSIVIIDANGDIVEVELEEIDEDNEYQIDRWGRDSFGPIVAYDIYKIVEILSKDMEVDNSEMYKDENIEMIQHQMAYEYYEYNIEGGYVGEFTPIHLYIERK